MQWFAEACAAGKRRIDGANSVHKSCSQAAYDFPPALSSFTGAPVLRMLSKRATLLGRYVSNHAGDVVGIAEDALQPLRVAACFLGQVSEARCMLSDLLRWWRAPVRHHPNSTVMHPGIY
jgi:hypothetical protein